MNLSEQITKGPWTIAEAKWHKDGPIEGYTIYSNKKNIVNMNTSVHESSRIMHQSLIDEWKPDMEKHFTDEEAAANIKAIAAVPEMLSIVEKLAESTSTTETEEARSSAISLLKKLNS